MVILTMDISGLSGFFQHWSAAEISRRATRALEATVAHIALLAKELAPKDTGRLAASITYDVWGSPFEVWGKVIAPTTYAYEREYGRPPGAPLIQEGELIGWMQRKGIPETMEDALRWSIHLKGSPPTPFMRPAVMQSGDFFREAMMRELFGTS